MDDSPIRSVSDSTARQIVARAAAMSALGRAFTGLADGIRIMERDDDLRDAIHNATPCKMWFCPTSGETECGVHGGFDVCCHRPDLHRPVEPGAC
ncbi:hypothetical protein AB0B63_07360 [Micromonospora sp. NPDC049081]|uniref:hypothetical protein n=1 Tax=Micromonospora sp. NPDC049081 TaxID=3155150 RepID=UPI0034060A9A